MATIREITGVSDATLAGLTVSVNGKPAPLLNASPTEIRYQLPWELDPQFQPLFEITFPPPRNPFDSQPSYRQPIAYYWPTVEDVEPLGRLRLSARHADGTRVSPERPASPGEGVSIVMSGLGMVAPTVTTGVPASADPLSVTVNTIVCNVSGTSGTIQPTEVSYAGLAPFQIGIYQINFRLPSTLESLFDNEGHGYLRFACGLPGSAVPNGSDDVLFVQ
jgi:uncharacterized protein (TIGR03437 family)